MEIKGFRPDEGEIVYLDETISFTRIDESSPTGVWEDDFIEIITPKNANSKIISFLKGAQRVADYIWDDTFSESLEDFINEKAKEVYFWLIFHYIINMLKKDDIMNIFKSLASSQGFYGRVVSYLESLPENEKERNLRALEEQNFKDEVDLILYMES